MNRVFITGIGIVSPVGNTRAEFWQAVQAGRSGIRKLENLDTKDLPITIGGEVRGLDPKKADVSDKVASRRMDRASVYAVVATGEALADAGLTRADLGERCGVILGSGLAGLATLQEQTENLLSRGPRGVSPLTIPLLMPNAPPANVSLAYDIQGPGYNVSSACSSSGHSTIDAFECLRRGDLDLMVTGGTEAAMTRLAISAFANMKAMTKSFNDDPAKASRPFDADRDGFVMSEGAAILVMETEASVRRRGVKPYLEMVGYGSTLDSFHLVQPDPSAQGAMRAIRQALAMAKLQPEEIAADTYVNAHGTSTKYNDLAETVALKEIFGAAAKKLRVSSTKGATGHLIGAACATETAVCALALRDGILPPTANYATPDPECDLDYIPNEPRSAKVQFALNNSFGFGGHNVCLAFQTP